MKKRLLNLYIIGALAFGLLGLMNQPASAIPTDDLTDTARYFPAETLAYVSIRTDEGYTQALQDFLALIDANSQGAIIPPNMEVTPFGVLLADVGGPLIDTDEITWLGDTLAFGVLDGNGSTLTAVEITDKDALLADVSDDEFLEIIITEEDGYTVIESRFGDYAVVTDDVVFFGLDNLAVMTSALAQDPSLLDNANFTAARSALPEDEYNIFAYVDAGAIMTLALAMQDSGGAVTLPASVTSQDLGVLALGATVFDGRTLSLDVASIAGGASDVVQTPVDLDFAAYLPGYTQLLIHDANLAQDFAGFIASLDAIAPLLQDFATIGSMEMNGVPMPMEPELPEVDLSTINIGGLLKNTLIPVFAGFTGLNLEQDIINYVTEDYTLAMSLIGVPSDLLFSFDVAMVATVTDTDAATNVINGLIRADGLYRLGGLTEDNSLSYPDLFPAILSEIVGFPPSSIASPELTFRIGANEDVFAIGTAPSVDFALNPSDDSLANNPVYQYAQSFFLADAASVWYVNAVSLAESIDAVAPLIGPDADILQFMIAQLESATISQNTGADGAVVSRLTLTLPESVPYDFPMPPMTEESSAFVPTLNYNAMGYSKADDGTMILGNPDAPITVVVFSDFFCGFCQTYNEDVVSQFVTDFVATGLAQYEYRTYPVLGDTSVQFAQLLECSGTIGGDEAYWIAKDILFDVAINDTFDAVTLSTQLGFDVNELLTCAPNATAHSINTEIAATTDVSGTPGVRVRYGGGDLEIVPGFATGGIPYDVLAEIIEAANE